MKLTEEQVLDIAKRDGVFRVSPRYRDNYLRTICKRLKKKGLLVQIKYGVFEEYALPNKEVGGK